MTWDAPQPQWSGTRTSLVAVDDASDAIVGFITCGTDQDRTGEVSLLYVDPERDARGVGRMLWDEAVAVLTAAGSQQLVVWVIADNHAARSWYEHRGLAVVGRAQAHLGNQRGHRRSRVPDGSLLTVGRHAA